MQNVTKKKNKKRSHVCVNKILYMKIYFILFVMKYQV